MKIKEHKSTLNRELMPINRTFDNEEGLMSLATDEVWVQGRRKDTTVVETKEFYSARYMGQEEILRYSNVNLVNAVKRLINVVVVYVTEPPFPLSAAGDWPHYEIITGRGYSGASMASRMNGMPYWVAGDHIKIIVDGVMVDEHDALQIDPMMVESIEKLGVGESAVLVGAKGGLAPVISITTKKIGSPMPDFDTRSKRDAVVVEKRGYYNNRIDINSDKFIPTSKLQDGLSLKKPSDGDGYILKVKGIGKNGQIYEGVLDLSK